LGFDIDIAKEPVKLATSGTIDLSLPGKPIVKGISSLSLKDASFSDTEGLVMGEGIDFKTEQVFSLAPLKERGDYKADFKATALLKGFEFAAGGFYMDFTEREIALETSGAFHNDALLIEDSLLKLSDIASLGFNGRVDGLAMKGKGGKIVPVFDLSLALNKLSNELAYERFLKDSVPALANFDISGTTSLEVRLKGTPSGFTMLGELRVKETSLVKREQEPVKEPEEADGLEVPVVPDEPGLSFEEEEFTELNGLFSLEELKALEAAVQADRAATPDIEGAEGVAEVESLGPKISIVDMNATVPFYLSYPNTYKGKPETERPGSLVIGGIRFNEMEVENFKAAPLLWDNRFSFSDGIEIPVFSGVIALTDVVYENIVSPERELSLGVDISGIKLSEVGAVLGMPPLSGTLTGSIPVVTLAGSTLRTEGLIELNLFNGRIGIRGIEMDNLLSPIASFKSSIEIDSLDLAELTGAFEFGFISGILTGYVQDLVIMDGLPVSFSIQMETIKTKGVSQKIDVKALKKIQVFSSGSSVSILDKGIYRFFKEYGYSRMGFSGRLADDRFSLLGVEAGDNKRYIVVGALVPPRVDVVSHTRDISFAELIKRLKRVQQTE
jgi:hypothetical protein